MTGSIICSSIILLDLRPNRASLARRVNRSAAEAAAPHRFPGERRSPSLVFRYAMITDRTAARARLADVPNKSKFFQSLSPPLRQPVLILPLTSHPSTKGKAVFFVGLWNTTMTFAFLVHSQTV
jgi:hypothetical protein